jgi:hypothetical protein
VARDAVPALVSLKRDPDPGVRQAAEEAVSLLTSRGLARLN